ncbi:MAG: carbamoyl-phosphate synthase large subunit [Chloroflexi bacterium]|nr:carbamoyl-phosphate synthase large subunit [Chloroflexota bacterium]
MKIKEIQKPKKILIIGSGPIVIGQAAEFDYAGAQACKAMHEEGVQSVLVNSNPATIMTDEEIADVVYIEPLTVESLEKIIAKECPDALLSTMGGQTGLNLTMDLHKAGVLDRYNVRVLGSSIETIAMAEDRELFKEMLQRIGEPVPPSETVNNYQEALAAAHRIGLPLIVRPAYTLGGTGGGFANTWEEFNEVIKTGLEASPINQILLEKSLRGWKEIEYEVMRDANNNCVTICNMENIDPMGVHTGDSIVVAPTQTLTDKEYQMMRTASLNIIRALGIEGGCNVQMCLDPCSSQYYVIEVNPRVSRSSALASKATGYPIARVAAKIAVGRTLDQITNVVTGKTTAAFEPSIDYIVVKIPRWPFDKFESGDRIINTQMKATGEVMAIDRSFESALQKAVRSLEFGKKSILWEGADWGSDWHNYPLYPNDLRLWALLAALRRGAIIDELYQITNIDKWFLNKLQNIVNMEKTLLSEPLTSELLFKAKKLGFADSVIATLSDYLPEQVRDMRKEKNIIPVYKMVDTCAAEFMAATPYFYSTYENENEATPTAKHKAVVIGSGPIRIGQGIEFDYCSVHSAWTLKNEGYESIMINSNPETVSTDFDTSSRLYFEALDSESVRDILENEGYGGAEVGVITQFGGQTAINLADILNKTGHNMLGSSSHTIDLAEDREQFEQFLSGLGIPQAPGAAIRSVEEALKTAEIIGYPVMVRPSFVLGGRAMEIVHSATELVRYMKSAIDLQTGHPILIDKYLIGKEVEVDAICDGQTVFIPGIMEHIERAGVHSGDSMAVYPPQKLSQEEQETIVHYALNIGKGLGIIGLMNIQFVVTGDSQVYVIEVNPRSSRTVPFLSKVTGVPMVDVATKVMLGHSLKEQGYQDGLYPPKDLVAVKAPVFSMNKLSGVDTYLGPEMKSTGEVMGIDHTFNAALIKALKASGLMLPPQGAILLSIADRDKPEALKIVRMLYEAGYSFYATAGTAEVLSAMDISVVAISKKLNEGHPNVVDIIKDGTVQGVINTVTGDRAPLCDGFHIRRIAAEMRIPCYTSLDTAREAAAALLAQKEESVKNISEYRKGRFHD